MLPLQAHHQIRLNSLRQSGILLGGPKLILDVLLQIVVSDISKRDGWFSPGLYRWLGLHNAE